MIHAGRLRRYIVRVPARVSAGSARVPLVIVMHGGGGDASNAENMTGFTPKAMKEGFIVVYPEGTSRFGTRLLTWNAGHCCGYAMQNKVDDVGYISSLIDTLVARYPLDAARVYATGMSNGGMMSHRVGIDLSSRIAAIAPVVGTVFGDERKPTRPVAAYIINGMLDTNVPNQGGPPSGAFPDAWDGTPSKPALEQGTFWAAANGCAAAPTKQDGARDVAYIYRCPTGREVELRIIKNNGHAWPGGQAGSARGDKPTTEFNATDAIWEFFKAHRR